MRDLQRKRRKYPKKTFFNFLYKEIGNSIYGQVAMGISDKRSFDVKTQEYISIHGGILSNPILSSYITGFTRSLIAECLNNINKLGGFVVSVTTDGFITNIDDLENEILEKCSNTTILSYYRNIRKYLTIEENDVVENISFNESALEIKHIEEKGIIS